MPQMSVRSFLALAAAGMACASAGIAKADITFSDTEFATANWGFETVSVGPGGTATASQVTGGNPGFARQITTNVNGSGGAVYALSRYGTSVSTRYDATVSGAITSVDFTIDSKFVTGDTVLGQSIGIGAKQGSVVYYAALAVTGITGTWGTQSASGLTAASFVALSAGPAIDFSATGAPIRFGFISANSAPGPASVNTAMYDNWSVTVHNVPAPATGGMLSVAGLVMVRRRRR